MKFTWNPHKNHLNIINHNLSFQKAKKIFKDSSNPVFYDMKHSTNEDRYLIYGLCDTNIIVVSFTVRSNKKYRLITARQAKDWEIEKYYKAYKG